MNRIVYLHGFASSSLSSKARFFGRQFAALGIPFDAPDLDAGDFEHLTISGQLRVMESVCQGQPVTLMGSSMGGYLAALFAARHPEVTRLVLMAPAFDFPHRYSEIFGPEELEAWKRAGHLAVFHYGSGRQRRLSYNLIEDARQYEPYPDFHQPTLILHGTRDTVVPSRLSEIFTTSHSNAQLILLDSGHELTDVLDTMWSATLKFLSEP